MVVETVVSWPMCHCGTYALQSRPQRLGLVASQKGNGKREKSLKQNERTGVSFFLHKTCVSLLSQHLYRRVWAALKPFLVWA